MAGHRGQALIVWRHHENENAAQVVRVLPAEELTELLWRVGLLATTEAKENAA